MGLTFHLALYLSIIGLVLAVPNPRIVRRCVISDLELKKCNDIVASCHVPDVSLVCVQKSSTEDCMRSIMDKETDAMFLDAGEVYRASLSPYNLEPIIAEQYQGHIDLPKCLKERQKSLAGGQPKLGAFTPECDEKGDYKPQQCHASTGHCWCVNSNGEEIPDTKTPPGKQTTCEHQDLSKCLKERQKSLAGGQPKLGAFTPVCDEKGDYKPQQCHASTGYCWCVNSNGEEIPDTKIPPGKQTTCEHQKTSKCLLQRQKLFEGGRPAPGRFVPQCDETGNYKPQQCYGSTGFCWCVTSNGDEIPGTRARGKPQNPCVDNVLPQCLEDRRNPKKSHQFNPGFFIPECDEKGNYKPQQCHTDSGYCWCVDQKGFEIGATPPGHPQASCDDHKSDAWQYAVAVVHTSSSFKFNELKGKKSCHSGIFKQDGWYAPLNVLIEKKLLNWDGPEKQSAEEALSGFFSASCIPGAKKENLCSQCAGKGEKRCKSSHDEPYYSSHGALRCLEENKGDVAFTKNTALSELNSEMYQLLCPDNTKKPLNGYKNCNFGRLASDALVTRRAGDKTQDITERFTEAQKKHCSLFKSAHGEDLLFKDSTKSLAPLPPGMDAFLFLGAKWFNIMKGLEAQPPPKNKVRWCAVDEEEKKKCDNWSAVSRGAISCTESSSPQNCVKQILKNEADAVSLGVHHTYEALKCGLVPAMEEYYNKAHLGPCEVRGSEIKEFVSKYTVAVVKKDNKDINWNNLKGKKACHAGVDHIAEWKATVSLLSKEHDSCDMGSFFGESCVPGSDPDSNLCKLCSGDPTYPQDNTKCFLGRIEIYHGSKGAFRCLVEKGDVAFVVQSAILDNTDGKNQEDWAKDLKSSDFELLCPDGSRAPFTSFRTCKVYGIPPNVIVTREESVSEVVKSLINQESLYGPKGFARDTFQMFSSKNNKNLLFNDDTLCLIEFDRQPTGIMEDLFAPAYQNSPYFPNKCFPPSELTSACSLKHC